MNLETLTQFDNVRDFAIALMNELEDAKNRLGEGNDIPDVRFLTHTLDSLIELEHEADFVDSIYNDDDVDPDDASAPFNTEGPIQQWFTDKSNAVELGLKFHGQLGKLYRAADNFEIEASHQAFRHKDDYIDLNLLIQIRLGNFIAVIPGRIFKHASIDEILNRINIQYKNSCFQPNWEDVYKIDPRQLDPRVIPNYDVHQRRQKR